MSDGKPDVREVYAKTRAAAQKKLDELRRQLHQGTVVERHTLTVADLLDQWIADAVARGLRPKTLAKYRLVVRLYLRPGVGQRKLVELRAEDVRKLCAGLMERGLSAATVRDARSMLRAALRLAMSLDLVGRNVAEAVRPPKLQRPEIDPPGSAAVAKLLDTAATTGDRLQALWTLAVYSGCRPGELLGLKWSDVIWSARSIAIRRTLSKVNGSPATLANVKTPRARRSLKVPGDAVDALRAHQQRQIAERLALGPDYDDQDLVFATHLGTPLGERNVVRAFKALLTRSGLPATIRLYDLRHAHATALLAAGVHPKVASERLGHASAAFTLDTYTHAVEGLDADAAEKVQRAIRAARLPVLQEADQAQEGN